MADSINGDMGASDIVVVTTSTCKAIIEKRAVQGRSELFDVALSRPIVIPENLATIQLPAPVDLENAILRHESINQIYIHHLRTKDLCLAVAKHFRQAQLPRTEKYKCLIELYLMGCKCQDKLFQDDVMDALLKLSDAEGTSTSRWRPSWSVINNVYLHTPTGSPLRKFLVDIHVRIQMMPVNSLFMHSGSALQDAFYTELTKALDEHTIRLAKKASPRASAQASLNALRQALSDDIFPSILQQCSTVRLHAPTTSTQRLWSAAARSERGPKMLDRWRAHHPKDRSTTRSRHSSLIYDSIEKAVVADQLAGQDDGGIITDATTSPESEESEWHSAASDIAPTIQSHHA